MRILIFHGYLLGGTGSNVYNARLARALVGLGHEVHLLCQERHPERHPFVSAWGDWDAGPLRLRGPGEAVGERSEAAGQVAAGAGPVQAAGSCTLYRPNIGALLPVYVADHYEGVEARPFSECSQEEVAAYIAANVAAVAAVCARVDPEIALANHLVMGPVILARALGGSVPYAVKVHGSALEYTVKPEPGRFLAPAREGLAGAACVLVGSHHTAASLWAAIEDPALPARTRLGPPGVDVEQFAPREPDAARAGVLSLARGLAAAHPGDERHGDSFARDDRQAAAALALVEPQVDRLVVYVGKLIVSKGVDLLLAAWPLVLGRVPNARLLIVGFGAYREGLEALAGALSAGDLTRALEIGRAGRSLEEPSADRRPLRHLLAFLTGLGDAERERYLALAAGLSERILFTGRLDHEELTELLPACEALVVPSTFPEAFGMVAAEAAACGVLPISAAHSGLSEVSEALALALPERAAGWLSFPVDAGAVGALAGCVIGWLEAEHELRSRTRSGLVATVRERWSWDGVARGVIAAARGELEGLLSP